MCFESCCILILIYRAIKDRKTTYRIDFIPMIEVLIFSKCFLYFLYNDYEYKVIGAELTEKYRRKVGIVCLYHKTIYTAQNN